MIHTSDKINMSTVAETVNAAKNLLDRVVGDLTKDKFKQNTAVEKRVEEVRQKLGLDSSDTDTRIDDLSKKVDALTAAIRNIA